MKALTITSAVIFSVISLGALAHSDAHQEKKPATKAFQAAGEKSIGKAGDPHHAGDAKSTPTSISMTDGEIRKVDKDAKKLTIKHGPIQNLDMPAMTMVFQVKDTGLLDQVKAGDMVKFSVEKTSGAYVVTRIEAAK